MLETPLARIRDTWMVLRGRKVAAEPQTRGFVFSGNATTGTGYVFNHRYDNIWTGA